MPVICDQYVAFSQKSFRQCCLYEMKVPIFKFQRECMANLDYEPIYDPKLTQY